MNSILLTLVAWLGASTPFSISAEPRVIADFEGTDYGPWKTTGTAFGVGPARGPLPGQMHVDGFTGQGLVNSYHGGDRSTGTLESPPFRIDRKYLTFHIGGGGWQGATCLNLIVDGQTVRTATGPNIEPGGSERLAPAAWDVSEFAGREAKLIIIDNHQESWGHLNVDQIVLTDDQGGIAPAAKPEPPPVLLTRTTRITGPFLQLPLVHRLGVSKPRLEKLTIHSGGKLLRYMHVELAKSGQEPDFHYSADLREFQNREVTLTYKSRDPEALNQLTFSTQEITDPQAYESTHRPRLHFSPRLGWMNDINGSYWHDGLYHVFYQFNPSSTRKGAGFDMHWGHSVSKDLVNWEEWPVALFPDASGQCYSGTAVLQQHPVPGLNEGVKLPAPALFFTATEPFSQHIATSPDGGRSWKRFAGNPVVPTKGEGDRDPKVIWHEASQHYVMVLYVGGPDTYRILRSKELTSWEETSSLPHWYECPEFIPVKSAVTGEELMLLYGCYRSPKGDPAEPFHSNSCYQLGRFDGKVFTPVTKLRHAHRGPNFYGSLIFINEPKSRAIMMGWTRDSRFPGERFNQCTSLPLHLQIKALNGQDTLCFEPAEEVNALRGQPLLTLTNVTPAEATAGLETLSKDAAYDIVLRIRPTATAGTLTATTRSLRFDYDAATQTLKRGNETTPLHPGETLDTRFILDRGLIETFWNHGEAAYAIASLHTDAGPAFALAGEALIETLTVYPMASAAFTKSP